MNNRRCRPVPLQVRLMRPKQRRLGRALHEGYLAYYRKQYESGHFDGVLHAVDICLRSGRKVPLWAVQPFCDCFLNWAAFRVRTLDEAFKTPPLSKRKFNAARMHNRLRPQLVHRVVQLNIVEGMPLGGELFAKVANEQRTSEATVRRIYYAKMSEPLRKIFTNDACSREITKPLS
jgi:hypothetical protein